MLYDFASAVVTAAGVEQLYHFDASGNLIGDAWTGPGASQPITSYLYSGESFDFRIGQQYLRARWYDAHTGRFNRLADFAGNKQDPQSSHKYAYVHGDPILGVDPTGMFVSLSGLGSRIAIGARLMSSQMLTLMRLAGAGAKFVSNQIRALLIQGWFPTGIGSFLTTKLTLSGWLSSVATTYLTRATLTVGFNALVGQAILSNVRPVVAELRLLSREVGHVLTGVSFFDGRGAQKSDTIAVFADGLEFSTQAYVNRSAQVRPFTWIDNGTPSGQAGIIGFGAQQIDATKQYYA